MFFAYKDENGEGTFQLKLSGVEAWLIILICVWISFFAGIKITQNTGIDINLATINRGIEKICKPIDDRITVHANKYKWDCEDGSSATVSFQ